MGGGGGGGNAVLDHQHIEKSQNGPRMDGP